MEKEQEHINENSCAYAEIVSDCFYNSKNDFFSSKDFTETWSLRVVKNYTKVWLDMWWIRQVGKVPNIYAVLKERFFIYSDYSAVKKNQKEKGTYLLLSTYIS